MCTSGSEPRQPQKRPPEQLRHSTNQDRPIAQRIIEQAARHRCSLETKLQGDRVIQNFLFRSPYANSPDVIFLSGQSLRKSPYV